MRRRGKVLRIDLSRAGSGRSAAWVAHLLGVQEVGRSNRLAPTIQHPVSTTCAAGSGSVQSVDPAMPTAAIELAEIHPSNKQEFGQVLQEYLRELDVIAGGEPPPGQTYAYPFWEELWRESGAHARFWIVVGEGKVGFILLRDIPAAEWPDLPLPTQITEFCVFLPFRNREIGSAVLKFLIDDFRQRGEILTWDCLKLNTQAERLYDRVVGEYGKGAGVNWLCRKTESLAETGPTLRYVCVPDSP